MISVPCSKLTCGRFSKRKGGGAWRWIWRYAEVIKLVSFLQRRRDGRKHIYLGLRCRLSESKRSGHGGYIRPLQQKATSLNICTVLVKATPLSNFSSGRFDFPSPHPMTPLPADFSETNHFMWEPGKSVQIILRVSTHVLNKILIKCARQLGIDEAAYLSRLPILHLLTSHLLHPQGSLSLREGMGGVTGHSCRPQVLQVLMLFFPCRLLTSPAIVSGAVDVIAWTKTGWKWIMGLKFTTTGPSTG